MTTDYKLDAAIEAVGRIEGWGVFDNDVYGVGIERIDEMAKFPSDYDALVFVKGLAEAGSAVHKAALEMCAKNEPRYIADLINAECLRRNHEVYASVRFEFSIIESLAVDESSLLDSEAMYRIAMERMRLALDNYSHYDLVDKIKLVDITGA